ncbi:transposase [Ectothiorhodospira sp. BSL-9]|nr:transposase [Ectothiorhodospira sp. BSL-9]
MISTADRRKTVELIDQARAKGARLTPACEVAGICARTYQRWTAQDNLGEDRRPFADRPRPANALSPEEEQAILDVCNRPEYASLPPDQILVRLLDEEDRYLASVSTFYRVLRRHGQVAHRGRAKAPRRSKPPTTHQAHAPNRLWVWDCTWLPGPARGTFYYLIMILDVFSRKVVGWEVFSSESADNATQVIQRAVLAENIVRKPLVLHADNGSPFKAATLLEKLRDMNIDPSFSRPRVSNDNAYAEALFRTCKYVPGYPAKGLESLDKAREWVHGFVRWYNHEHRHSAIRFVTPAERHRGEDKAILVRRHQQFQRARQLRPERWTGKTRNWSHVDTVTMNPERVAQDQPLRMAA